MLELCRKTRIRGVLLGLFIGTAIPGVLFEVADAQSPARGPAPAPAKVATTARSVPVEANLAQLMRGTLYPSSNVIFAAQDQNPDKVPPAKDPATATDPLASAYGKWTAVENSGLAIAEAATLLTIPGRKCANGRAVPLQNADWAKFVQGLRDAGMAAYKAAQSKNQDNIVEAAGTITEACANCHDKYREKPNLADRCK
ncbi:MAG TPA: cytochrome c [Terriglobales bacterium]|nr:cytochrome c [Terriglobales bacterium]